MSQAPSSLGHRFIGQANDDNRTQHGDKHVGGASGPYLPGRMLYTRHHAKALCNGTAISFGAEYPQIRLARQRPSARDCTPELLGAVPMDHHRRAQDREAAYIIPLCSRLSQCRQNGGARAVLKRKKKDLRNAKRKERHRDALCFMVMGPCLLQELVVGGWGRLAAVGDWRSLGAVLSIKQISGFLRSPGPGSHEVAAPSQSPTLFKSPPRGLSAKPYLFRMPSKGGVHHMLMSGRKAC